MQTSEIKKKLKECSDMKLYSADKCAESNLLWLVTKEWCLYEFPWREKNESWKCNKTVSDIRNCLDIIILWNIFSSFLHINIIRNIVLCFNVTYLCFICLALTQRNKTVIRAANYMVKWGRGSRCTWNKAKILSCHICYSIVFLLFSLSLLF